MPKSKEKRIRDPEGTRAEILKVAFWQVFLHGFQAVSVNEILAHTSLTKGAFFHHFPTKQDLGYAIVDETLREMTLDRWIRPLAAYANPLEGIVENLGQIIETMPEEHLGLGCPLNNLIQEMSNVDPVFREKLGGVLEIWIAGVEAELRRAQRGGLLREGVSPRHLAEFVVMNHEGAFGMTKILRDRKVFRSLLLNLKRHLESVAA